MTKSLLSHKDLIQRLFCLAIHAQSFYLVYSSRPSGWRTVHVLVYHHLSVSFSFNYCISFYFTLFALMGWNWYCRMNRTTHLMYGHSYIHRLHQVVHMLKQSFTEQGVIKRLMSQYSNNDDYHHPSSSPPININFM